MLMLENKALEQFVLYFGELGMRWGLPSDACKVHAYLYVMGRPFTEKSVLNDLNIEKDKLKLALDFLIDYKMIKQAGELGYLTSEDPWEMLSSGLEERRRRELPLALETLSNCHQESVKKGVFKQTIQIEKMLKLVESLATLDEQMQRFSPQFLRGFINVSSSAAQFMNRTFGPNKGRKP